MSPERTSAYRRVTHTLAELGPSKLWDGEQDRIREAADTLIFSVEPSAESHAALEDVERLCRDLVISGRWTEPTAATLLDDVAHCGPVRATAGLAA
jgi:hypothetical protein